QVAKHSKPLSEGEFVKECLIEVANILCPENSKKFEQISLSRRTVTRRIDSMAEDIKSTDISDTAQLAIFIRAIDENFTITEELLALQAMKDTTRGDDIFEEIAKVFNAFNLDWAKLNGVTTDGAPAMLGKNVGVIVKIKAELSNRGIDANHLFSFHCIIHQEDLCAKTIKFKHVMEVVVSCVNFIKSRGLNHRQFQQFLQHLEAEYGDKGIIFYCEVRWLSRGKMLMRFYELREEVQSFMDMKGKPELVQHLKDNAWLSDLAFLVDVTGYLNELNRNIQKPGQFVHELFAHIKSFQAKLRLWEIQLRSGNAYHFPTLSAHKNFDRDALAEVLRSLNAEFTSRFQDFRSREQEFEIFINPFIVDVEKVDMSLQMELIQLQADDVLKNVLNDLHIPSDSWKLVMVDHNKQRDGYNCGIFVMHFIENIVLNNGSFVLDKNFDPTNYRIYLQEFLLKSSLPMEEYCIHCSRAEPAQPSVWDKCKVCLKSTNVEICCGIAKEACNVDWLQCEICKRWCHHVCTANPKIPIEEYQNNTPFKCKLCSFV
ncbi:hypothetical protein PPYR_15047, partial [Photinus pyralis]